MDVDVQALLDTVGTGRVLAGDDIPERFGHDEALTVEPRLPQVVVLPESSDEVAAVLRWAASEGVPVVFRGAGTGLAGGAVAPPGGVVVSFERMARIIEIDEANLTATVQAGATLADLDRAAAACGLRYPVDTGERTATLGGTVATNAGGMRAVRDGVTRQHVLGLEAVLASGEVLRTGGKLVKCSSGYDLTQLLVGSEGTLAAITEVTLRLEPRRAAFAAVIAPFPGLAAVTEAVPGVLRAGVEPVTLEYLDFMSMKVVRDSTEGGFGIPEDVASTAMAWLVVALEEHDEQRLATAVERACSVLTSLGAIDVYVPPPAAARHLLHAREQAFWTTKQHGFHDIVDAVVPRAGLASYLDAVAALAAAHESFAICCGHAGDGNVHLSVFQPDEQRRGRLMEEIYASAIAHGGAVSGEHGLGTEKAAAFRAHASSTHLRLLQQIKAAFDPAGLLGARSASDLAATGEKAHSHA